jgi:PIN domain nuclease of toxin-antitoxin system
MLDTHVFVWWAVGDRARLSAAASSAIALETESNAIIVSSIAVLEIAQLVHRGRLQLAMDVSTWLASAETIPGVVFVPVENEIAVKSFELPGAFHKDPADRITVATARKYAVPLVTADELIRGYPHVRTIW